MSEMPPKVSASMLQQHGIDKESVYSDVATVVENHPDAPQLMESLAARFADNLKFTEYGRDTMIYRPQTHEHKTLAVSHFDRMGAGTNVIVTVADTNTDEIYVLMAQKYKDPKRPELGLQDQLITVGGYMEAHAPEGAPDPDKPYDKNLAECAMRELKEETGLELPEGFKPVSLGTRSDFGVTNDPREHTVVEDFHVNMYGSVDKLPPVKAQDDIAALHWMPASTIMGNPDIPLQPHNSEVSRFSAMVLDVETNEPKEMLICDHMGEPLVKAIAEAKKTLAFLHDNPEGHQLYTPSTEPETYGNDAWPNTSVKDLTSELHDKFHGDLAEHYDRQMGTPKVPELRNLTHAMHDGTLTRDFAAQSLI